MEVVNGRTAAALWPLKIHTSYTDLRWQADPASSYDSAAWAPMHGAFSAPRSPYLGQKMRSRFLSLHCLRNLPSASPFIKTKLREL